MKHFLKLTLAAAVAAGALNLASCGCCTSETSVPPLRPVPNFDEPVETPAEVVYSGK